MPKRASPSADEAATAPRGTPPTDSSADASRQVVPEEALAPSPGSGRYTVVARRYRPRNFDELVGQQTVAAALKTAIQSDRVGHADLFTGARGVGKTSTARIFAKALNAGSGGPQGLLDDDLAQSIDRGEDMDVIEIDGASNRGIEEIRQLRAGATVRPSRAQYKIYIIDEVHMLTLPAFNALLKTLEEPPSHVKFILCTTDPEKVPITVLSRCQRFDFPPIRIDQIQTRLCEICKNEGVEADDEALRMIARRANGSMRDSQSLLEQLLSFAEDRITLQSVHEMLGTADDSRLRSLVVTLVERRAGDTLRELDEAIAQGVDAGQLGEQLLGYLRDLMAIQVGAAADVLRSVDPADSQSLRELTDRWGTMTLLSALQMLDDALVRMRQSVQSRILLEVCLVQICQLQDLQSVADLAEALRSNMPLPPVRIGEARVGSSSSARGDRVSAGEREPSAERGAAQLRAPEAESDREKKNATEAGLITPTATRPASDTRSNPADRLTQWRTATQHCEGMIGECAAMAVGVEEPSAAVWEVLLPAGAEFAKQILQDAANATAVEHALERTVGRRVQVRLRLAAAGESAPLPVPQRRPQANQSQLIRHVSGDPVVERFIKTLDAEILKVDVPPDYRIE